jgi:zinc transport system permease protein
MIGALLMAGLIVVPVISSMCFAKTYKRVTIVSCILSEACFVTGLFASFVFSLPTGAAIVAVNIGCYGMCYAVSRMRR